MMAAVPAHAAPCRIDASAMAEVALYSGAAGPPAAWTRFLAKVVTPRFPDGFTSLDGSGQWRGPRGIGVERTHVLVIYYRRDATSDARIDAIRGLYKRWFRQRSVLRADSSACVGF